MKSKISALVILSCLLLTSCTNNTQKTTSTVEQHTQTSEYVKEYSAIFNKIQSMNDDSMYLIGLYETAWSNQNVEGLDDISLHYIMNLFDYAKMCIPPKSEEEKYITGIDLYNAERRAEIATVICPEALNEDKTDIISGTEDMVNAACGKYQNALESIPNASVEIKEAIKTLRINYPDNSTDIDKLHNYYIESSYLAEFAPEPTVSSLDEYRNTYNEITEKINTTEKYADLY